jgi:S-formylglutathione hydrolase FrmB
MNNALRNNEQKDRRGATVYQLSPVVPNVASLLLALLSALVLFNHAIISNLVSLIVSVGLDPLRAQLIAALTMTAGAALAGAIAGRRKVGAMLGAGSAFYIGYLAAFIQLERQPVHDPGGNLELLNSGALVHTSAVMLALALLSAFAGSAVGLALGEVLLDAPLRLARLLWQRSARRQTRGDDALLFSQERTGYRASDRRTVRETIISWLSVLMLIVLLALASSSSDLFFFSPDIGLHAAPLLHKGRGSIHGTLVKDEVTSPALGNQRRSFLVYLPPSYNTPAGRTKRYPTLYLLHGSPGNERDWVTAGKADQSADTLIALGKIPELILILPDGNGRLGETSEWGNSFDHRQNIETYVAVELVRYVDARYRTLAGTAYRGIGGLSMGGFGAMNIALHHPATFGFVIALGGYYRAEGSIWGKDAVYIRENSPIYMFSSDKPAWRLHLYIGVATRDQPYYSDAQQLVHELTRLHIPYQLDVEKGYHSWQVWQTQLYHALTWLHWGAGRN